MNSNNSQLINSFFNIVIAASTCLLALANLFLLLLVAGLVVSRINNFILSPTGILVFVSVSAGAFIVVIVLAGKYQNKTGTDKENSFKKNNPFKHYNTKITGSLMLLIIIILLSLGFNTCQPLTLNRATRIIQKYTNVLQKQKKLDDEINEALKQPGINADEYIGSIDEYRAAEKEVTKLETELTDLERDFEKTTEDLEELQNKQYDLSLSDEERENLENLIEETEKKLAKLKRDKKILEQKLAESHAKADEKRAKVQDLKDQQLVVKINQKKDLDDEFEALEEEAVDTYHDANDARDKIAYHEEVLNRLGPIIKERLDDIKKIEEKKLDDAKEKEELESKLESAEGLSQEEEDKLNEDIEQLKQKINDATNRVNELNEEIEILENRKKNTEIALKEQEKIYEQNKAILKNAGIILPHELSESPEPDPKLEIEEEHYNINELMEIKILDWKFELANEQKYEKEERTSTRLSPDATIKDIISLIIKGTSSIRLFGQTAVAEIDFGNGDTLPPRTAKIYTNPNALAGNFIFYADIEFEKTDSNYFNENTKIFIYLQNSSTGRKFPFRYLKNGNSIVSYKMQVPVELPQVIN